MPVKSKKKATQKSLKKKVKSAKKPGRPRATKPKLTAKASTATP